MSHSLLNRPAKVAIVGGTHGNELTGIYTLKHWQKSNRAANYPDFNIELVQANQAAADKNKRYLDQDLNRCFKQTDLNNPTLKGREQQLAKQLNAQLGPKGDSRVDFIIDLHTSTANMQINIVLIKMDKFHLLLAAYLKSVLPNVVVTSESELMEDHHFLCSIADKGMVIEVGPTPQGSLDPGCFAKTNAALESSLEFLHHYQNNSLPDLGKQLEVMSYFSKLYFPQDNDGEINAMIHPNLLGKDYSKITPGTPLFQDFSGKDILYSGEACHIAFVNEAAYYDQKIAMNLCQPRCYCLTSFLPLCKK